MAGVIKESGGQDLSIGAIADGEALRRSGTTIAGVDLATQAELDTHAALTTTAHGGLLASTDSVLRTKARLTAYGLIAASTDPLAVGNTLAPSTQNIFASGVYLYAGEIITGIVVCVSVGAVGTAPTMIKLGLWDAGTPTCRAVTADLSADARWTSNGYKFCAFTGSTYTVPSSGMYYPTFLKNGVFATTDVQLILNAIAGQAGQMPGFAWAAASLGTGKTAMAVNDTGAFAATTRAYWMGVY